MIVVAAGGTVETALPAVFLGTLCEYSTANAARKAE